MLFWNLPGGIEESCIEGPGQDLKLARPEYKSAALPLDLACPVNTEHYGWHDCLTLPNLCGATKLEQILNISIVHNQMNHKSCMKATCYLSANSR
jgi:hypothetical protein